jgi:hypothetical protein
VNWGKVVRFLYGGSIRTVRCTHKSCPFKYESMVAWDYVRDRWRIEDYWAAQVDNHPTHRHPDWDEETA